MPHRDCSSRWCGPRPSSQPLRPSTEVSTASCGSGAGWLGLALLLTGGLVMAAGHCVRVPRGIQPVQPFDIRRYTGTWYEIARIDHVFERGLTHTSAHYAMQRNGKVQVINRGYDARRAIWKESEGTASFLSDPEVAALKVSFFGPFYGGYNVVGLDADYQHALVIGSTLDYCWLLSRHRRMGAETIAYWLDQAEALGVDRSQLIHVPQD